MKKLMDVCDIQYGYAFDSKKFSDDSSFIPLIRIRDVKRGYSETFYSGTYSKEYIVHRNDLLIGMDGEFNIARWSSNEALLNQRVCKIVAKNGTNEEYLRFAMSRKLKEIEEKTSFVTVKHLSAKELKKIILKMPNIEKQNKIANILVKLEDIIKVYKKELEKLNSLVQARFVELFGDLKSNNKRWPIVGFKECADIDTNMIHNFEGYEDYPHIGINCIEKETGRLIGYRTIAEDGVISGKYLFTPKHIIYSKIRPNLNKVALPDFKGLCSADAYPILVKSEICNREYFGYTLRSKYFLDYILAFSNRTNLPKVNKNQVEGFMLPLPPIDLQNQFAAFVQQVNKSKFVIHKFLYCTTHNTKSIIKPRPNTKESGKIRGGKPHADEF